MFFIIEISLELDEGFGGMVGGEHEGLELIIKIIITMYTIFVIYYIQTYKDYQNYVEIFSEKVVDIGKRTFKFI